VLPGVYVDARSERRAALMAAVMRRFPNAVLCGPTAAQLTYWPDLSEDTVHVGNVRVRFGRPGYCFTRRQIPPEFVAKGHGLRCASVPLTAMDLAVDTNGESIDRALRGRATTLPDLRSALAATPCRAGNRDGRRLLLDSRAGPWSVAERRAHRILRSGRVRGWIANYRVGVRGNVYYLDIAFPGLRVAIEIDGLLHERNPAAFENDRRRQNDLILAGWTVLRFTWRMLVDEPDAVLATVRAALACAQR
jgi:very-short-patch-repair endonuclease